MQRHSKPIQTSRIVTTYNVLLLGEVRRAVCGFANQLWVPERADGWKIEEGAGWYCYCLGWGTGREGGSGWFHPKIGHDVHYYCLYVPTWGEYFAVAHKQMYLSNPHVKSYRLVYIQSEEVGGGGWLGWVSTFWDPPSRIVLSHFYRSRIKSLDSGARAVDWHPLSANWDSDKVYCVIAWSSQEGSLWTCEPVVGAWKGMYAWASAAQFLPYNSAATHYVIALSMQMDGEFKEE
eukprot:1152646-Pelagomonas_calceolata.AAC.8